MDDKDLLETILKALVSQPNEVGVRRTVDEMGVLLRVELGEGDAGMVIGKRGETIQAIRTIIRVMGAKNQARVNIKLDVPEIRSRRGDNSELEGRLADIKRGF